jgi:hypothetical protein
MTSQLWNFVTAPGRPQRDRPLRLLHRVSRESVRFPRPSVSVSSPKCIGFLAQVSVWVSPLFVWGCWAKTGCLACAVCRDCILNVMRPRQLEATAFGLALAKVGIGSCTVCATSENLMFLTVCATSENRMLRTVWLRYTYAATAPFTRRRALQLTGCFQM